MTHFFWNENVLFYFEVKMLICWLMTWQYETSNSQRKFVVKCQNYHAIRFRTLNQSSEIISHNCAGYKSREGITKRTTVLQLLQNFQSMLSLLFPPFKRLYECSLSIITSCSSLVIFVLTSFHQSWFWIALIVSSLWSYTCCTCKAHKVEKI